MSEAVLDAERRQPVTTLACQYRAIFRRRVIWLSVLAAAVLVSLVLNIGIGPSGMKIRRQS